MAKWVGVTGAYTFEIKEVGGNFDLDINFLGDKTFFWFNSYQSARNFIRDEYGFTGRMKKVVE